MGLDPAEPGVQVFVEGDAIILAIYRSRRVINVDEMRSLKG